MNREMVLQQQILPSQVLPTLEQIEQVLQTLFNPTGSSEVASLQNEANRWLLDLQNNSQIVNVCLELIKPERPFFSQFYGLQTLYTKIHADWEARWNDELRLTIKSVVFNRFLAVINDNDANPMFLAKLASVIAAVITHSVPRLWEEPVSDLLQLIATKNERLKRIAIDILTMMPQEFNNVVLSVSRRLAIKEHITRSSESVIYMISKSLESDPTNTQNAQLLLCFKQWIYHSDAKAMINGNVLGNLFKVIDNRTLIAESFSIIGDLINFHTYRSPLSFKEPVGNKNIHSSDEINYEQFIVPIIRKLVSLKSIYNQSTQDENQIHITRVFAEILSQIVECYTPIITDITKPDNQQVLAFLIEICQHSDKEMSELTFDAWSYLADHLNTIEDNAQHERFQQIYAKLLQILIQKSSYPTNNDNPSAELIEDISSYRNNVCDIIMACFETIQEEPFLQYIDNLLRNECKIWQSYEVVVYVFSCIHTAIEEANNRTFNIISLCLSLPIHPVYSKTVLLMLIDYGEFITESNDLLQSSYQYIISLVNHQETREMALMTLLSYSQNYGDRLYMNIESTINSFENIFKSFKVIDQKNFVESILLMSSYITNDGQANNVFQKLLYPIIVNLNSTIVAEIAPPEKSLLLKERLSVLESSLKIPEEYFHIFKDFSNNVLPLCERVHEFSIANRDLEILEEVWKILYAIQMEMGTEAINIEQLFNYLTTDITTFHSLTNTSYDLIDLLIRNIGYDTKYNTHFTKLFNTLSSTLLPIISNNDNSNIPVISKFYRVLTALIELMPNVFYSLTNVVNIVELSIISLLTIEIDSVQKCLQFLDRLFIKMDPHEKLLANYSSHIVSNLFIALVNDTKMMLNVYLSKALFDWINKYPNETTKTNITNAILNAKWLPQDTPQEEKERLVSLVLGKGNDIAKFKLLIKDICQVCNNQLTWDVFLSYEL